MLNFIKSKLSTQVDTSDVTKIISNMKSLESSLLSRAVHILGPSEMTAIHIHDSNVHYSTLHGNICAYSLAERKVVDDLYFSTPITHFIIDSCLLAISTPTELKLFTYPDLKLLHQKPDKITSICSGILTGNSEGKVERWTQAGCKEIFTSSTAVIDIKTLGSLIYVLNETEIVSVCSDDKQVIATMHVGRVFCFDVSEDFIAVGSEDGVMIYLIEGFKKVKSISSKFPVTCLDLAPGFLAVGFEDGMVKVYDIAHHRNESQLRGHKGSIIKCCISPCGKHIVTISKDLNLMIWAFPEFPEEILHHTNEKIIKVMLVNGVIVLCKSNKTVCVVESGIREILVMNGVGMSILGVNDLILIGDDLGYIYVVKEKTYHLLLKMQAHNGAVRSIASYKEFIITGGADSEINLWSVMKEGSLSSEDIIKKVLLGHKQAIWQLEVIGDFLISGSSDKTIRIWDLLLLEETGLIDSSISALCVNTSGIVTGDHDGIVKFWNLYDLNIENSIEAHMAQITDLAIEQNLIFSSSLDGHICVISYEYRTILVKVHFNDSILCMSLSPTTIITGFKSKLSIRTNCFFESKFSIQGPPELLQIFLSYCKGIYLKRHPKHNQTMDQFLVLPYYYNLLHIYTFLNLAEYIKDSLDNYSPMFAVPDSPLTVAMLCELNSIKLIFLKNVLEMGKNNPYYFRIIQEHIMKLNREGHPELFDIYQESYVNVSRSYLPKTCALDEILPRTKLANTQRIQIESFFSTDALTEGGTLSYSENYLALYLYIGSAKSIEFITSLIDCPNLEVLRAEFIQDMVKLKWEVAWYPMFFQTCFYFLYMLILNSYVEWFNKDEYCLGVLFGVNLILIIYETFQMIVFKSYFSSVWNYLDWLRSALLISYTIIEVQVIIYNETSEYEKSILGLLTISSWVRGISYFRIFKKTRYLIRLLQDSINIIKGYIFFLAYFIIAFTLFNMSIDKSGKAFSIIYVLQTYNLALGSLTDDPNYELIDWICLTVALLLLCIIIMNILISIIGESFEKVQTDSISADTQELLEMILEVENMFFTRRQVNKLMYFQKVDWASKDQVVSWEGKIRALGEQIKGSYVKGLKDHYKTNEAFDLRTRRFAELGSKIDKLFRVTKAHFIVNDEGKKRLIST